MTTFAKTLDAQEKILITNLYTRAKIMAPAGVCIANSRRVDWLLEGLKVIVKIIFLGLIS
jgi:hypothetical protein